MNTTEGKLHQLTIYLAKDSGASNADLVKVSNAKKPLEFQLEEAFATLYVRKPTNGFPEWANLLQQSDLVPNDVFDSTASTGALLVVRISSATFLVTFGLGHTLHNPESIERDFGLRVAINSTNIAEVRSMDKATNESTPLNSRTQSSLGVEIEQLLIDTETDLLYALTGSSKVAIFGATVTGRDSLSIKPKLRLKEIPKILQEALSRYKQGLPKEYAWVNNIRKEKDKSVAKLLDSQMVNDINTGQVDKIWMGEPEIIDWEQVFGYSFDRTSEIFPILSLRRLTDYLKAKHGAVEAKHLHSQSVHCNNAQLNPIKAWTAHRCLYAEVKLNGSPYILRDGVWYRVADNFVKEVDRALARIPMYSVSLPDFNHKDENDYNEYVATQLHDVESLDRDTVSFGGRYSKIEVCDLIKDGRDLIHVKKYTSSATLSHLFSQGYVSAETLKKSEQFRQLFNQKLPASMKMADPVAEIPEGHYQVVYAIYSDKQLPKDLPFFSKLTLKNAYSNLRAMGYKVALADISISSTLKAKSLGKPAKTPKKKTAA